MWGFRFDPATSRRGLSGARAFSSGRIDLSHAWDVASGPPTAAVVTGMSGEDLVI